MRILPLSWFLPIGFAGVGSRGSFSVGILGVGAPVWEPMTGLGSFVDRPQNTQLMNETIVIFDTEQTAWEGSIQRNWALEWEHREVIQIGALTARWNGRLWEETAHLLVWVRPERNPQLSPFIIQLTGITQEILDSRGLAFEEALTQLHRFAKEGQAAVYSWGPDDEVLRENAALHGLTMPGFPAGFHDLREVFRPFGIDVERVSSGRLSLEFGIQMPGQEHDALFDSRSLLAALNALCDRNPAAASPLLKPSGPS